MRGEASNISNAIDAVSDNEIQYDQNIKNVLADKQILARILKYSLDEFEAMDVNRIIPCIEGQPHVGEIPLEPGLTNAGLERIAGGATESSIPGEGAICFDIRFHTIQGERKCKILIDLEAQRASDAGRLGYHIENRMSFYIRWEMTPASIGGERKIYISGGSQSPI